MTPDDRILHAINAMQRDLTTLQRDLATHSVRLVAVETVVKDTNERLTGKGGVTEQIAKLGAVQSMLRTAVVTSATALVAAAAACFKRG